MWASAKQDGSTYPTVVNSQSVGSTDSFTVGLGDVDIHTLSHQMGTSVATLEQHDSKLTATMAAKRLG